MLRLVVLGLILACAVSLGCAADILDKDGPHLWGQTAEKLADMPKQEDFVYPNPWQYLYRMTFYRLMIAKTDPYMPYMGSNATDNPMWGLVLQLAWLQISGRLADPTSATTCGLQSGDTMCISTQSWYSCLNYFISALPFLSAAHQGLMGEGVQVKMEMPAGVEDFCATYDDCAARYPDVMAKWDAFFQGLKAANDSNEDDKIKKDKVLGLYWKAQVASLNATGICNARNSSYSSEEMSFAHTWLDTIGYVSASHFHSSLHNAIPFIVVLPSRTLKESDKAPDKSDLSDEEKRSLSVFSNMQRLHSATGGLTLSLWKRAMCSAQARERGSQMLGQIMLTPSFGTLALQAGLIAMAANC